MSESSLLLTEGEPARLEFATVDGEVLPWRETLEGLASGLVAPEAVVARLVRADDA